MDEYEAVAEELEADDAIYAFKPKDVETRFLLGEEVIVAAAMVFLKAFLEGVNNALKQRGIDLGEKITNWIVDKLEGLFRKPKVQKADEAKLKEDIQGLSKEASKYSKTELKIGLDAIEGSTYKMLIERGVLPSRASKIAKKTREAAEALISKEGGRKNRGTK